MSDIVFWTGAWPQNRTRTIGAYQLSYWLRTHNIQSRVIDFCQWFTAAEIVELTELLITNKTKFIGVSTTFWGPYDVPANILEAQTIIKQRYPHLKFVYGGARVDTDDVKKIADIIITGEAEEKLVQLIKGHNIGIRSFDITCLEHRYVEEDCIIEGEVLPLELGRGCIFKCKFCGHHNLGKPKHTYQRQHRYIEEELAYNYEQFKTTKYLFLDDTVNEDPDKVQRMSTLPTTLGFNIQWTGYLRLDLLNSFPDTPYQLLESGLKTCYFGVETFHPKAGTVIGKGWNGKKGQQYIDTLYNNIWKKDVPLWMNYIVGLPYETAEDIERTVQWCEQREYGYHNFVSLNLYKQFTDSGPRSEFSINAEKYGYKFDDNDQWFTEQMTQRQSIDLAAMANQRMRSVNSLAGWMLFDTLQSGLDINILKKIKRLPTVRQLTMNGFNRFLDQYKQKVREF